MVSANHLDHTVINTRGDMDPAVEIFQALGFTLTPRGYHSHGSINHLMMFGSDFLELIGIPEGRPNQRPDLAAAPVGINGLVFKTDDADAVYAHLEAEGMAGVPVRAFTRPVILDDEEHIASFRTTTVNPDVFKGGRVYFCEHGTPELVWRSEWQNQPNRVVSMPEFVVASTHPAKEAADFARLLNGSVEGNAVPYADGKITVLSVADYQARYGDLASDMNGRSSIFGAIVCACDDMGPIGEILATPPAGVAARQTENGFVVYVTDYDSVLEFVPA
jgi:hypothetical protein